MKQKIEYPGDTTKNSGPKIKRSKNSRKMFILYNKPSSNSRKRKPIMKYLSQNCRSTSCS